MSFLPPLLAEIAEAAGERAALLLMRDYGGQRVYIPLRAPDGHWLVELVGRPAADRICEYFAARVDNDRDRSQHGAAITVPVGDLGSRGRARAAASRMLANGASTNAVAAATGVCQRTVWNYKARVKDDLRRGVNFNQADLFAPRED